jgi:DNA-directed RNA polymerase specialized sigma24 family protein
MRAWGDHEAELRGWLRRRLPSHADADDQLQLIQ